MSGLHLLRQQSTFSRSMLSAFELTIGNWAPITRFVHHNITEWFTVFLIAYNCTVSFAVMMVIRGIFLHETFQIAGQDDQVMILKKQRQLDNYIKKMTILFNELDDSGDGFLNREEFEHLTTDPRMKAWLAAMEIDVQDAGLVFRMVDDGDNRLTVHEVVAGFAKLKGPAKQIDMARLFKDSEHMKAALSQICEELGVQAVNKANTTESAGQLRPRRIGRGDGKSTGYPYSNFSL